MVEVDGDTHDASDDRRRDDYLRSLGYDVVRMTNADVMTNIEGVVAVIRHSLASLPDRWPRPHPNPSPEGEGLETGT